MSLFIIGCVALRILSLAFFILLVARIATGFHGHRRDDAMAALERRFVAGDIAEIDFRRMRDILKT